MLRLLLLAESAPVPLRWNQSGITLAGIPGSAGSAAYQLSLPNNLVLDPSNAVYATETYQNRVQKFPVGLSNGSVVAGQASGLAGASLDQLWIPSGIDVDAQENVYISDKSNARVMLWRKDARQGSIVAGVNGKQSDVQLLSVKRSVCSLFVLLSNIGGRK